MAALSNKCWRHNRGRGVDAPPKTWSIVRIPDTEQQKNRYESGFDREILDWCNLDRNLGEYCWASSSFITGGVDSTGFMFAFSDSTTAFAFKLRWG